MLKNTKLKSILLMILLPFNIVLLTAMVIFMFYATKEPEILLSGKFARGTNPNLDAPYYLELFGDSGTYKKIINGEVVENGFYEIYSTGEEWEPPRVLSQEEWEALYEYPYETVDVPFIPISHHTPIIHQLVNSKNEIISFGFYTNNGFLIMFDETGNFSDIRFYRRISN